MSKLPFSPSLIFFAFVSLLACGCVGALPMLDPVQMFEPEPQLGPDAPQVSVEMRPLSGSKETKAVALADGDSIEAALQRSGAIRRFRQMEIQLYRANGQTGSVVHPLRVEFDAGARRIPAQYDYALQKGDRLVVSEKHSSPFDDLVTGILGPFSGVDD